MKGIVVLALASLGLAERLPMANISSESSVVGTKLHCLPQYVSSGSATGGDTFGNDTVSGSVNFITTAGNSTDYMSATRFCTKAGYQSCDELRDVVSNLAYFGLAFAQNTTFHDTLHDLYGTKGNDTTVKPQHLKVVKEFAEDIQNNKSEHSGPKQIKLTHEVFDHGRFQVTARVSKQQDSDEFTTGGIRASFNVSGQGEFHDLNIPAILVSQSWASVAAQPGDPSSSTVQYVGVLPQAVDVIGQMGALMQLSLDNVTENDALLPTSLRVNYRIEILSDKLSKSRSPVDVCGDLTAGIYGPQTSLNLTTATVGSGGLMTESATAPPSAITSRKKSSDAVSSSLIGNTVIAGVFLSTLFVYILF